jgi:hypothetical protein
VETQGFDTRLVLYGWSFCTPFPLFHSSKGQPLGSVFPDFPEVPISGHHFPQSSRIRQETTGRTPTCRVHYVWHTSKNTRAHITKYSHVQFKSDTWTRVLSMHVLHRADNGISGLNIPPNRRRVIFEIVLQICELQGNGVSYHILRRLCNSKLARFIRDECTH